LDTGRWFWEPPVTFPTSSANSPKRTYDRLANACSFELAITVGPAARQIARDRSCFGTKLAVRRMAVNAQAMANGSTSQRPSNSLDDDGRILIALCNREATLCEILEMLPPHASRRQPWNKGN
jgi:hypothetical protein